MYATEYKKKKKFTNVHYF